MADNKNIQDGRDSAKIDIHSDYELSYLQEKFGVTREQVRSAVEAVGNNRTDVEKHLQNKSSSR